MTVGALDALALGTSLDTLEQLADSSVAPMIATIARVDRKVEPRFKRC